MKKIIFISLAIFILFCSNAMASIYPPNCVCQIKAQVLEINETPVKNEYVAEGLISVNMTIQIIKVEKMIKPGISEKMTCDVYAPGKIIKVTAIRRKDFVDAKLIINPNDIIRANIEYSGDENGQWYNFDHIEKAE